MNRQQLLNTESNNTLSTTMDRSRSSVRHVIDVDDYHRDNCIDDDEDLRSSMSFLMASPSTRKPKLDTEMDQLMQSLSSMHDMEASSSSEATFVTPNDINKRRLSRRRSPSISGRSLLRGDNSVHWIPPLPLDETNDIIWNPSEEVEVSPALVRRSSRWEAPGSSASPSAPIKRDVAPTPCKRDVAPTPRKRTVDVSDTEEELDEFTTTKVQEEIKEEVLDKILPPKRKLSEDEGDMASDSNGDVKDASVVDSNRRLESLRRKSQMGLSNKRQVTLRRSSGCGTAALLGADDSQGPTTEVSGRLSKLRSSKLRRDSSSGDSQHRRSFRKRSSRRGSFKSSSHAVANQAPTPAGKREKSPERTKSFGRKVGRRLSDTLKQRPSVSKRGSLKRTDSQATKRTPSGRFVSFLKPRRVSATKSGTTAGRTQVVKTKSFSARRGRMAAAGGSSRHSLRTTGGSSRHSIRTAGGNSHHSRRSSSHHRRSVGDASATGSSHHRRSSMTKTNIFCSEMVSTDFVMSRIEEVQADPDVVTVEFEDLLERCTRDIAYAIKDLLNEDRPWEKIRFIDEVRMNGSSSYRTWTQHKKRFLRYLGNVASLKMIPIDFCTKLVIEDDNEDESIDYDGSDVDHSENSGSSNSSNESGDLVGLLQSAQNDPSVTVLDLRTKHSTMEVVEELTKLFQCDDREWQAVHLQLSGNGPFQDGSAEHAVWCKAMQVCSKEMQQVAQQRGIILS